MQIVSIEIELREIAMYEMHGHYAQKLMVTLYTSLSIFRNAK